MFVADQFKNVFLVSVIGAPVLGGFLWIINWGIKALTKAGKSFFFYIWAFVCGFSLFINTIYPIVIQPMFNKFDPLPEGDLKKKIESLATKIKFPLGSISVIDGSKRSSHSNAYFFGLWKDKKIVIFDTLLDHNSTDEILAVVGHELGHWQGTHQWKRMAVVQIHMFITFYIFNMIIGNTALYSEFSFNTQPVIIGFLLFQVHLFCNYSSSSIHLWM